MSKINIIGTIPILKVDEDKRLIKTAVYTPYIVDTQGDWADQETIEKAAHGFMENLRQQNVDTHHNYVKAEGVYICESYINKGGFDEDYGDGAWVIVMKVCSDEIWEGILDGEFGGVSMAGSAVRICNVDPPSELDTGV